MLLDLGKIVNQEQPLPISPFFQPMFPSNRIFYVLMFPGASYVMPDTTYVVY